jgi:hypothetical protein
MYSKFYGVAEVCQKISVTSISDGLDEPCERSDV